jgi:ribosome recycling factor
MGAVESGLRAAPIGINPVNNGRVIRLPLPELTQERRQELIKVLGQKMEAARVSIRKVREEVKELVELAESEGEMGEDEKFKQLDELEKAVKEFN